MSKTRKITLANLDKRTKEIMLDREYQKKNLQYAYDQYKRIIQQNGIVALV